MNRRILLEIAYDGSDFAGWQRQNNQDSVQGRIELGLEKLLKSFHSLHGSGRTDSGVHARGQTAHFDTTARMPVDRFPVALNSVLPKSIRILHAREVPSDFHARYNAVHREYRYYLYPSSQAIPYYHRYSWRINGHPDLQRLNALLRPLIGSRDYTSFSSVQDKSASRVRNLLEASAFPQGPFIVLKIGGNAFLWKMIRTIAGTVVELEARGAGSEEMERILQARNREAASATAPPWGLSLHRVIYPESLDGRYYRRYDG